MLLNKIHLVVSFPPNVIIAQRLFSSINLKYLRPTNMDGYAKSRENPHIKTLDTPQFKAIFTEELNILKNLFDKYGHEIRIAGGPVRDLLMGIQPKDIDLATTATPTEMKDMFEKENVRMLNVNGEKHGTITPRINDKENFEVTTLRIDIATDGRRAQVEYTKDWKLDANRRDLTINSMFLDFDGKIYDYFYGYDDLMARKILFVGTPESRIIEDYLRILRYFRFYGRIANNAKSHDEATLKAIAENSSGLERISGERVWMELKKILAGNFAGDLMLTMLELGLGKYLGIPEKPDTDELKRVWTDCIDLELNPVTLLASVVNNLEDAIKLNDRLKMSCVDRDLLFFIAEYRHDKVLHESLAAYQKMYLNTSLNKNVQKTYLIELLKYNNLRDLLKDFEDWKVPHFPINGSDLVSSGFNETKLYAIMLKCLKNVWVDSDFKLTKEEMIELIPSIRERIPDRSKSPPKKKRSAN